MKLKSIIEFCIALLIFCLISVAFYVNPYNLLADNLLGDFYLGSVTFFVGIFIIYLYKRQKADHKQDVASIILMEIRNAETTIDSILEGKLVSSDIVLLPTNNWTKNNYLFIKDLDRDNLDLVNKFYNQCALIDQSITQLSIANQLNQKANHIQRKLSEVAYELTKGYDVNLSEANFNDVKAKFEIQKSNFVKIIESERHIFSPDHPKMEIEKALYRIETVTTSSAGEKLKKIARLK